MHCQNYVCSLESGCACRCEACQIKQVCKTCGACPECGATKEKEIVYIPYPVPNYNPGWYCGMCSIYHPYGYTCGPHWIYIPYYPTQPNITTPWWPNVTITYSGNDTITTGVTGNSYTLVDNYQGYLANTN